MTKLVSLACLAALTVSCGARDAALTDKDRDAIRAGGQKYIESDAKRDADGMMQIIAESAVYMPPGAQPLAGREAIRALFTAHPWDTLSETPAEIEGRSDFAIVRGQWKAVTQQGPAMGYYIEVWNKQSDGAWRITRKVWNTVPQ